MVWFPDLNEWEDNALDHVECYECQAEIYTEDYWSVNVHKEKINGGVINVLHATAVAVYCNDCASRKDLYNLQIPPKAFRN